MPGAMEKVVNGVSGGNTKERREKEMEEINREERAGKMEEGIEKLVGETKDQEVRKKGKIMIT
jgi:hypothetical protein